MAVFCVVHNNNKQMWTRRTALAADFYAALLQTLIAIHRQMRDFTEPFYRRIKLIILSHLCEIIFDWISKLRNVFRHKMSAVLTASCSLSCTECVLHCVFVQCCIVGRSAVSASLPGIQQLVV